MNMRWLYFLVHGEFPGRSARRPPRRGPARDARYRAWIRTLPCVFCGSRFRVEAAHTGDDGGMRQKASDYSCVPACWDCHQGAPYSYHRDRKEFERRVKARHRKTVRELVRDLNQVWQEGRTEAA